MSTVTCHIGVIEARHDRKEPGKWYNENNFDPDFCKSLSRGGYIKCGNSGGLPFYVVNGSIEQLRIPIHNTGDYQTCGFHFGKGCSKKQMWRRWSCCHREIFGTMDDLIKVQGCVTNTALFE